MLKKTDVATDITSIKNNYVTNDNLTSQLNKLKSQHITDEVKKVEIKSMKIKLLLEDFILTNIIVI